MTKKAKTLTVVLLVLCFMLQFVMISGAVTEGSYSKTLPNWQTKVELISGTNAAEYTKKAYMTFSGGTANYIYVQVQLGSGTAVSSGWLELSKSDDYRSVNYTSTLGAGTDLKIVAYQKHVKDKTASGYIYI